MPGAEPSIAPAPGRSAARRTVLRGGARPGLVGAAVLWGTSGCGLRIGSPARAT